MTSSLLYASGKVALRGYAELLMRMDVVIRDPLPSGPRIIAANHPTAVDPFLLHVVIPGRMSMLITKTAFDVPIFGAFLRKTGQIPVTGLGEKAFESALRILAEGRSVALFPEGTYSPRGGGFQRPRTTTARLAMMSGAPVIPIGIHLPPERSLRLRARIKGKPAQGDWNFFGPCHITIGKARRFAGDPGDRKRLVAAAEDMMADIRALAFESRGRAR